MPQEIGSHKCENAKYIRLFYNFVKCGLYFFLDFQSEEHFCGFVFLLCEKNNFVSLFILCWPFTSNSKTMKDRDFWLSIVRQGSG